MRLHDWIEREGPGALSRLMRATGLAYSTVTYIARGRKCPRYETAKRISEATGGEVSIPELCDPDAGHDSMPPGAP